VAAMIRKQLYLAAQHDAALKRLAARERRSEADIVREAVLEYAVRARRTAAGDRAAWDDALAFMRSLAPRPGRRSSIRHRMSRERLYEEGLTRGRRRSR